ncbi:type II toxin-antitoxin system RelE/ParE family toxin [Treponema zioleckii]|uniref:type II toxin-antitoxin system RelE/ParE family toxin n=1 Tax=Treponema zioleckii TaxID=331680 RepID=UPI00168AAF7F|nr:type II toxin-antitoxin system RelE/ParE family toxin [Treponema zioleckii]
MAYNVRIMETAEQDLSEIVTYFTDKLCNPKAAESLLEEFLEEKNNISDNPYMYPLSNDLVLQSEEYHRFLFKKNYIALYLIDDIEKEVSIMRIFYAKRDYANLI